MSTAVIEREQAVLADAALGEGDPPERIRLTPWGHVQSTRGDFLVDEEAARAVQEAFRAHGTDLPIDYEHQTLGGPFASPRGTAPAAGWITAIEAVPGEGLFARVTWTDEARRMLAARQYRYLSPVALIERSSRRLVALHSAALTNKPAIVGMEPLVAAQQFAEAGAVTELGALAESLHLPESASLVEVLAAARARISELGENQLRQAAEQRVAALAAEGRLCEAQRDWAVRLAMTHPALFEEWAADAPVLVPLGRVTPPSPAGSTQSARAAAARSEYRASSLLQALTSEEAYVAQALRENSK